MWVKLHCRSFVCLLNFCRLSCHITGLAFAVNGFIASVVHSGFMILLSQIRNIKLFLISLL